MKINLRLRILLTLTPLLALIVVVGSAGAGLLYQLGGSIGAILKDNYESVVYMQKLNEALERIDSSFQFALTGRGSKARQEYDENWKIYQDNLLEEKKNITLHPREDQLVEELSKLTDLYRKQGDAFYARPTGGWQRQQDYFGMSAVPLQLLMQNMGAQASAPAGVPFNSLLQAVIPPKVVESDALAIGPDGLLALFKKIKATSQEILKINQDNMRKESVKANNTAGRSLIWFGIGLVAAVALAALFAWHTIRTILAPIRAVTRSAIGISAGNLDQVVPVISHDELGRLADAFNIMARHLRTYRQAHSTRLLRAQRTSQATIDSFPDPVLVIDTEGFVEMANPSARQLLGVLPRTTEQPGGLPWQPPESLRALLQDALQGSSNYVPESFDRAVQLPQQALSVESGQGGTERRSFLPHILTIRDPYGNTLGAAVLLHDITRFRLLDQFKTDLVATASHELKTPLTSLRLDLHLLLEETLGPLTPKQTELLLDARDNAERLLAIVNNLLDIARLENKREYLEIKPERPADLLRTAADTARPRAQDKKVDIDLVAPSDLPAVAVDAGRLGYALNNLLDNALTYTNAGGKIKLSASAANGMVTLEITDTGCGIPPEYLPHVFERFSRVPGQSRGAGTGLGLAIVREIVTAQGGTATCASQPGVGSTFRLDLPIARDAPTLGAVYGTVARPDDQESGVRSQESGVRDQENG